MVEVYANDPELERLHNIGVQLAPELATTLRLLRHETDWPIREGVSAYVVIGRHIAIRNTLRLRGEWPGYWGDYVVFRDKPSVGLLLHEIGHRLPVKLPIPDDIEPTAENVAQEIAYLTGEPEAGSLCNPPWRGHEASWIRCILHLHSRAWQRGVEIGLPELQVAGRPYGLSEPYKYMHAIGNEPKRMDGAAFSEIVLAPFPDEFIALWRDDIAAYCRSNPNILISK